MRNGVAFFVDLYISIYIQLNQIKIKITMVGIRIEYKK